MKTVVFSDTHLTDVFDEKKFNFLKKIIRESDRVIINGDFWDGFITSFDAFVRSPWKKLFPLLKEKQAVYIYGNHDNALYSDGRVNLFSVKQAKKHILKNGHISYVFEHGHASFTLLRFEQIIPQPFLKYCTLVANRFERLFAKIWGRSTKYFGVPLNKRQKRHARRYNGNINVFGHTHYAEFDMKNRFINTGYVQYGLAQYLLIEEERAIAKEEKYS